VEIFSIEEDELRNIEEDEDSKGKWNLNFS